MDQELYELEFSELFVGKSFQEAAKILYFYKPLVNEVDLLVQEGEDDDRGILLMAINKLNVETKENIFLINPQNYLIQKGDQGIVVADSYQDIEEVYEILQSENSEGY